MSLKTKFDRLHELFLSQQQRDQKRIQSAGGYLPYAERFIRERITNQGWETSVVEGIFYLSGICIASDKAQTGYSSKYSPQSIQVTALKNYFNGTSSNILSQDNFTGVNPKKKQQTQPKSLSGGNTHKRHLYQTCRQLFSLSGFFLDEAQLSRLEQMEGFKNLDDNKIYLRPKGAHFYLDRAMSSLTSYCISHTGPKPVDYVNAVAEFDRTVHFFRMQAVERVDALGHKFDRLAKENPDDCWHLIYQPARQTQND